MSPSILEVDPWFPGDPQVQRIPLIPSKEVSGPGTEHGDSLTQQMCTPGKKTSTKNQEKPLYQNGLLQKVKSKVTPDIF